MDLWTAIDEERSALVADLRNLSEPEWHRQSLCEAWTVKEVVAHLSIIHDHTLTSLVSDLFLARFDFNGMNVRDARRRARASSDEVLARFEQGIGSRRHPPGTTAKNVLVDHVVHGQDIRRPLGLTRDFPPHTLRAAANILKHYGFPVHANKRIAGLRLVATDAEWTTGDGPEVEGPLEALTMTMAGRSPALDDLSGPGLATLRERSR